MIPYVCSDCGCRFWHGPSFTLHDCPGEPVHYPDRDREHRPTVCRACGQPWPCETAQRAEGVTIR